MTAADTGYRYRETRQFDRRQIDDGWRAFIAGEMSAPAGVDPTVLASWRRCKETAIDPHAQRAERIEDAAAFGELALDNAEIMAAANHTWDVLAESILASDSIFIVADKNGVILDVRGNSELVDGAANAHVAPGFDWSEASAGTNAIGTALIDGKPTIIRSHEHYCRPAKIWDCAAALVHDLSDGSVLGVLDVTSVGELSDNHTLAFAVTAAKQIEHTLHAKELARSVQLLNWYRAALSRWRNRATLLLDAKGKVITTTNGEHLGTELQFDPKCYDGHRLPAPSGAALSVVETVAYPWSTAETPSRASDSWPGGVVVVEASRHGRRDGSPPGGQGAELPRGFAPIITANPHFIELVRTAAKMARASAPVLLIGETGSGKELFARGIHLSSAVADGPFVAVNCGTLTAELAASELFGYEAGAFTGASRQGRVGKFQQADGGTLFLDEVGDLPLDVQVQLLRILQDNVVVKVGGNDEHQVKVRIIAATNRELGLEAEQGRFRQDLFYRLNALSLRLIPLRERVDDIAPLIEEFLRRMQGDYGLGIKSVSDELLNTLRAYAWPGNVRELFSLIESMYILSSGAVLTRLDLPADFQARTHSAAPPPTSRSASGLEGLERDAIIRAIEDNRRNLSEAARQLRISRSTLYRKLKRYEIPL